LLKQIRQRLKRVRIAVRLAVWTSVVLIVAMSAFSAMSLANQRKDAINGALSSLEPAVQSFERMLRVAMLTNSQDDINLMIRQIGRSEVIKNVSLTSHEGTIRHSSDAQSIGTHRDLTDITCAGCHAETPVRRTMIDADRIRLDEQTKTARILLPVYNSENCSTASCHAHPESEAMLGMIELDITLDALFEMLQASRNRMALFTVLLVAFSSVIVLLLIQRWVNRPVRELVLATRQIAEGNRAGLIPEGEAELGHLAHAFNQMSEKLDTSQRQLILSEKLITVGKLTAGVAHELNTPVTGILSSAEELLEELPPNDPLREECELIQRESLRCREIVKNLLDFGRQQIPEAQKVDLNEMINKTLSLASRLPRFKKVLIRDELAENLPWINADPGQVEQVFLNILLNAADAMPDGGEVFIRSYTDVEAGTVAATFKDSGGGIPPHLLVKIFEPFYSSKKDKGSGIGLAICAQIVKGHGGRIGVESVPGQGASFTVHFPELK
jgi:two-component system, NtrC family, sensor kinase